MNKERRLGRGLEALLSRSAPLAGPSVDITEASLQASSAPTDGNSAAKVNVHAIDRNPYQPRIEFNESELANLAESLRVHGLLQPIVVRPHAGRYQLISGERRLRAAMLCGWQEVPVHILEVDERETAELALVENLQRKDLNALEKAASFETYLRQYGCTQEQLAQRLQMDRSTVANLIRLLDLPAAVQESIRLGKLTPGHGRALLALTEERDQTGAMEQILQTGMSVRGAEQLVQTMLEERQSTESASILPVPRAAGKKGAKSAHWNEIEHQLKAALGAPVEVRQGRRGGKIIISYKSVEDFERLAERLTEPTTGKRRLAG